MQEKIYDVIGIGFNVSNIGLAISIAEQDADISMLFIEQNSTSMWQPEMLIDGSDIQNAPHRDLITPVNPRSKYTFINFLFEQGRLFEYFNLGMSHPLRSEYSRYVKWCADDFSSSVIYEERVTAVTVEKSRADGHFFRVETSSGRAFLCRNVSIGTGRESNIPEVFRGVECDRIFHLTKYASSLKKIDARSNADIAVIGSSQSSIEILLDLKRKLPCARLVNLSRGFGYRLKDTSPFSYEAFYPEFIDFFYNLADDEKARVSRKLRATNYSVVDSDVLNELYQEMYEDKLLDRQRVTVRKNCEVVGVDILESSVRLHIKDASSSSKTTGDFDYVVLATGFKDYELRAGQRANIPVISSIESLLRSRSENYRVARDYRIIPPAEGGFGSGYVYLNGLCESTHGLGDAGSFSSVSIRSKTIAASIISNVRGRSDGRDSAGHAPRLADFYE